MEGIPGEVGGALRMNAGAMGGQTFEQVVKVVYLDREGMLHEKGPGKMEVHYRHVPTLEKNFAVSAVFRGRKSPADEIVRRLEESQEKRRATQPSAKSAGCIFKNPAAMPAGKLVDDLGLKGLRVGDAVISEIHGNFIVNENAATAADMLELIGKVQSIARARRGIELETEVQIVGEES
jgi:UDP-N-acetylenolpyruvoylglucosamine reductase